MIEERREAVEQEIEKLKEYRQLRVDYYLKWDGIMPEGFLQMVQDDIHWAEEQITELRKQLPPPMSQRQLRALEEIPRVWAEVTGKGVGDEALWERMDKAREEALCEAADKALQEYADRSAGRIFIDEDNVAHVNGMIETPRMVIEAAPRRTGRTLRNWLCNYFK